MNPSPRPAGPGASVRSREVIPALASAIACITIVGTALSLTMTLLALRLAGQGFSAHAIGLNRPPARHLVPGLPDKNNPHLAFP
jgi:hypothetical protein